MKSDEFYTYLAFRVLQTTDLELIDQVAEEEPFSTAARTIRRHRQDPWADETCRVLLFRSEDDAIAWLRFAVDRLPAEFWMELGFYKLGDRRQLLTGKYKRREQPVGRTRTEDSMVVKQ